MKKNSLLKIAVVVMAGFLFFQCPGEAASGPAPDKVVARINGVTLTEAQLEDVLNELIPMAFFHGNITRDKRQEYRPKAMQELIKRELYYQEAKKTGVEVAGPEIEDYIKDLRERLKPRGGLDKAMAAGGLTMEELRNAIDRELTIRKFTEREIALKSKVSDEFLQDYYGRHKADFKRPEAVRLRMISIYVDPASTKEERAGRKKHAEEVLAKAKAGEDFAELASRYSDDDWRVKGGDFGIKHKGQLDPALEESAFAMKPGEISALVETIYGYHIMKVEERLPETQLSYEEVRDGLRKTLEDKRVKELEEALLKALKGKARIEIISPETPPVLPAGGNSGESGSANQSNPPLPGK